MVLACSAKLEEGETPAGLAMFEGVPEAVATSKLREHWARLGFRAVAGTGYMILDLARKSPSPPF